MSPSVRAHRRGASILECIVTFVLVVLVLAVVCRNSASPARRSFRTTSAEDGMQTALIVAETIALDMRTASVTDLDTDIWVAPDGRSIGFLVATEKIEQWNMPRAPVTYTLEPTGDESRPVRIVRTGGGVRRVFPAGSLTDMQFRLEASGLAIRRRAEGPPSTSPS